MQRPKISPFIVAIVWALLPHETAIAGPVSTFVGIGHVYRQNGETFVELRTNQQVSVIGVIHKGDAGKFPNALFNDGKRIQLTGAVEHYGDKLQITLTDPKQMSVG